MIFEIPTQAARREAEHNHACKLRNRILTPIILILGFQLGLQTSDAEAVRPNVLFIIADDASRHFGEAYRCDWVKTPNIDRLAKNGLVFENAYTPTSKCSPSRAAILTGRNPWQLEEAANHWPHFPSKYTTFSEVLAGGGIACGAVGKVWGPGEATTADGSRRDFGFGGTKRKKGNQPANGLVDFLKTLKPDQPFFYWFGSHHPHRSYQPDSGIAAGKKVSDIDRVPAYLPDDEIVRRDMLDYAIQVEAFDAEVGSLLAALEASGKLHNTLVIVTSDNGMPFPRVKGHTYDDANRIPLVMAWPSTIREPGRRITDLISFIDLAPTFLEIFGLDGTTRGMSPVTGRSFTDLFGGESNIDRDFVIIGRERNDILARPGSSAGLGYPVRAIREKNFLYVKNYTPERWPCGNPELDLKDTDTSPTKKVLTESGEQDPFWQHSFGKRPAEQLFDLSKDPDCVVNLAIQPDSRERVDFLRDKLINELKRQNDPRALGQGDGFDHYPSPRNNHTKRVPGAKVNP